MVASWACGKNARILMCDAHEYHYPIRCTNNEGVSGSAGSFTPATGLMDSISSVYITLNDPVADTGSITVWQDGNCTNDSASFDAAITPGTF